MQISGVDVAGGVIDLEFRVTVLEKIIQRLFENAVVVAGITQEDLEQLWHETFNELKTRYPNVSLEMQPPPAELTEMVGDRSKHMRFSIGWACPSCNWRGIAAVIGRRLNPGEASNQALVECPECHTKSPASTPTGYRILRTAARKPT
jgi:hypothetical protein